MYLVLELLHELDSRVLRALHLARVGNVRVQAQRVVNVEEEGAALQIVLEFVQFHLLQLGGSLLELLELRRHDGYVRTCSGL